MVRRLLRLLHCWWTADRIRASRRPGRLLALGPGSFLVMKGEPAQILGRIALGTIVRYQCTTAAGACDVDVLPNGGILARRGDREEKLDAGQVESISGPACSRPFNF